jgi:hypothetical protein
LCRVRNGGNYFSAIAAIAERQTRTEPQSQDHSALTARQSATAVCSRRSIIALIAVALSIISSSESVTLRASESPSAARARRHLGIARFDFAASARPEIDVHIAPRTRRPAARPAVGSLALENIRLHGTGSGSLRPFLGRP